jgi:chromate transporter
VFRPQGPSGLFDKVTALIGLGALLALLRYRLGVIPVIGASCLAGFLFTFLKPWLAQKGVFL